MKAVLRKEMKQRLLQLKPETFTAESDNLIAQLLASPEYARSRNVGVYIGMAKQEPDTLGIIRHALVSCRRVYVPRVMLWQHLHNNSHNKNNNSKLTNIIGRMRMCQVIDNLDISRWPVNRWGIPEPLLRSDLTDAADVDDAINADGLDLLLLPGLAFTSSGARLGRGGGFYDRYINGYRRLTTELLAEPPGCLASHEVADGGGDRRRIEWGGDGNEVRRKLSPLTVVSLALSCQRLCDLPLEAHDVLADRVLFPTV